MFKLNDFMTSINQKGVLKTNKYLAVITLPTDHYLYTKFNQDDLSRLLTLRCDSVQLPGISLASADGPPRLGYGPIEKHPYSANMDDIALTFIVDSNSRVHKMLYDWVNVIVNFKSEGGAILSRSSGTAAYEVGYRSKYQATMEIQIYKSDGADGKNKRTMTYTLYNCFPMGFPSSGMNWGDEEVLKINIPFAYTDYQVTYENES